MDFIYTVTQYIHTFYNLFLHRIYLKCILRNRFFEMHESALIRRVVGSIYLYYFIALWR